MVRKIISLISMILVMQILCNSTALASTSAFDDREATAFIGFIFNVNVNEIREVNWNDNSIYKLLTGQYQRGSREEAVAKIAFLSVAYEYINKNIGDQDDSLTAARSHLLEYLKEQVSNDEIIEDVVESVCKHVMSEILGWGEDIIKYVEYVCDAIKDLKDLPAKTNEYAERIHAAVKVGSEIAISNKRNMYLYFREYVNAYVSMGEYADWYMEAYDLELSQTIVAYDPILNWHSENNIQTLKRWAKYTADLEMSLSGQSDNSSDFIAKFVLNYPFAQDVICYTAEEFISFAQNGMYKQTRNGYTFVNWYYDAAGTIEYDGNFYQGMVLFAKWRKNPPTTFLITFKSNCPEVDDFSYVYDTTVGNWINHTVSRPGYLFEGWYWDVECTRKASGETITINRDLTFYAKWKQAIYTITYDSNCDEIDNYYHRYDSTKNNWLHDYEMQRPGYLFMGWYWDSACTNPVNGTFTVASDLHLYAKWKRQFEYRLDNQQATITELSGLRIVDGVNESDLVIPDIIDGYPVVAIGDNAFSWTNITGIKLPDSIEKIGDSAFSGCKYLTHIVIPEKVTVMGKRVFSGCSSLTYITLPKNITAIGTETFSGCTSLSGACYQGSLTDWNRVDISTGNNDLTNANIHYSAGISYCDIQQKEDFYQVHLKTTNTPDADIMVIAYDSEGLNTVEMPLLANGKAETVIPASGVDKIKVLLWDDIKDMKPLDTEVIVMDAAVPSVIEGTGVIHRYITRYHNLLSPPMHDKNYIQTKAYNTANSNGALDSWFAFKIGTLESGTYKLQVRLKDSSGICSVQGKGIDFISSDGTVLKLPAGNVAGTDSTWMDVGTIDLSAGVHEFIVRNFDPTSVWSFCGFKLVKQEVPSTIEGAGVIHRYITDYDQLFIVPSAEQHLIAMKPYFTDETRNSWFTFKIGAPESGSYKLQAKMFDSNMYRMVFGDGMTFTHQDGTELHIAKGTTISGDEKTWADIGTFDLSAGTHKFTVQSFDNANIWYFSGFRLVKLGDAISYTDAPYAGVYAVTSDKVVTLTNETGSTVSLQAGKAGYIYLIAGANNMEISDETANLIFVALENNGMDYFTQVDIPDEPLIYDQEDIVSDLGKTLAPGETYTFTYTPSKGLAGIAYPYIIFQNSEESTVRVNSDTGFYADIYSPAGYPYTPGCWADAARADIELLYVRNGENIITIENIGSNATTLYGIRIHSAGELSHSLTWGPQLNMANLKVVECVG